MQNCCMREKVKAKGEISHHYKFMLLLQYFQKTSDSDVKMRLQVGKG